MNNNDFFTASLDVRGHSLKNSKTEIKKKYITALTYIVEKTLNDTEGCQSEVKKYANERICLYKEEFFANTPAPTENIRIGKSCIAEFASQRRKKNLFMLVCDAAMILLDKPLVYRAAMTVKENLPPDRRADIDHIVSLLYNERDIDMRFISFYPIIAQYRANREFFSQRERRVIITANMSAGKSTLINALIGKPVARTSQEACTGNVCYLFNKAYEDGNVYMLTPKIKLHANADDLHGYDWSERISIASYFTGVLSDVPRVCVIDTPGVDAALHKEHSERAYDALLNEKYDMIIYVVSPTRLGTEAEKKHLKRVAENLRGKEIIFVINKIDNYNEPSDSVYESVCNFRNDLIKIGFANPVVCPISAYFSYLLKLKITGSSLSKLEEIAYEVYAEKFMESSYDLSKYYRGVQCLPSDSKEITLSKRAGLYGLEKIIYGGKI